MPTLTNGESNESKRDPQEKTTAILRIRVFTYTNAVRVYHFGAFSGQCSVAQRNLFHHPRE
jgi:hypothetical protein